MDEMNRVKQKASIIRFSMVLDDAEAGTEGAPEALRLLCAEICKQAPIEEVCEIASLVLRRQRAAFQQNIQE